MDRRGQANDVADPQTFDLLDRRELAIKSRQAEPLLASKRVESFSARQKVVADRDVDRDLFAVSILYLFALFGAVVADRPALRANLVAVPVNAGLTGPELRHARGEHPGELLRLLQRP